MAYSMYIDGVLLPVTPSKLELKIKNQNKPLTLIDGTEINVLKSPGLSEVKFKMLLPQCPYSFSNGQPKPAEYYLSKLEQLKTGKKRFQFIVSRVTPKGQLLFDTNLTVTLEEYEVTDDAGEGFDISVSVILKQWRNYGTKVIQIKQPDRGKPQITVEKQRDTSTAPVKKYHTVVPGDCLWNIAKKYLGDGSRYKEIYALNKDKIKTPNLIYPGQVLVLP